MTAEIGAAGAAGGNGTPWGFYDSLIAQIPEDVLVLDCCVGMNWSYLEAECGTGVSYTMTGGGRRAWAERLEGKPLRTAAELAKSWNFREATIGVAALNAWFSQADKIEALGGAIAPKAADPAEEAQAKLLMDPFAALKDEYRGKKVAVVGHFPGVEAMAEICDLVVLERNPRSPLDTPDPACEYILPSQDFIFATGVSIINKTAPRLIELGRSARFIIVGPSAIPSALLFNQGVSMICGRVVADAASAKAAVRQGASFDGSLRMYRLERPDA